MKIVDRYLVKAFFAPFAACTLLFSMLVVMSRFFEKMDIFNNYHAKIKDIVVYLLLGLPFWLNMVMPVATLLAVLFSLGALQQRGEITALRSAGIRSSRLYAPLFALGLGLSLLSLVSGLSFLSKCNFEARKVYRVRIKNAPAVVTYRKDHVVVAGRDHRRFTIGWLDVEQALMRDVIVDRFGNDLDWVETVSAKEAHFANNHWTFIDGARRRPDPDHAGNFIEEPFKQLDVDIHEKPQDFIVEDKAPEDMTGGELVRRIKRLRWLGAPSYREQVELQLKTALPFANLIVVALGIPFAIRSGAQGRAQTFAYALALAFMYWGTASICQSFGEHGHIPAWLAGWTANVLFTGIAAWRWRIAI